MTTIREVVKRTERFAINHSPQILTGVAVAGTITTAILTGKAVYRSIPIIDREQARKDEDRKYVHEGYLTYREIVPLVWKLYIPAVGTGVMTCVCIIGANQIGTRRAAAMATAFSLSERGWREYEQKVIELHGENKNRKIRDEIAQDRVDAQPLSQSNLILVDGQDVPCFDMYTGRYWSCSMEKIKKAQNDVNYRILNDTYASLTDFYDRVGLPKTTTSDELGWSSDKGLLEINFTTTMTDEEKPAIAIEFRVDPIRNYYKVH